MKLDCQNFDGTLEVICIKGGAITDAEHEEMERIIADAKKDAAMNKIQSHEQDPDIQLRRISYYDFLHDYDSQSLPSKTGVPRLSLRLSTRTEGTR